VVSAAAVLAGEARWHVERAEALAFLRTLPDACVDAVITDPPYSSGGAFRGDRMAATSLKYVKTGTKVDRPEFSGDNRDQHAFGYWCALWLAECARIAKPGAPICVFTDWRQLPVTADAIQAGGWTWRGIVPWDKGEGTRPQKGRFRSQAEFIVWGSNGAMPLERGVGVLPGAFTVPVLQEDKHHITGKPTDLMRRIVAICAPGGVVLDPFAGSASTGAACLRDGYRFIGSEMTEAYHGIAVDRLAAEERGLSPASAAAGQTSIFDRVKVPA